MRQINSNHWNIDSDDNNEEEKSETRLLTLLFLKFQLIDVSKLITIFVNWWNYFSRIIMHNYHFDRVWNKYFILYIYIYIYIYIDNKII